MLNLETLEKSRIDIVFHRNFVIFSPENRVCVLIYIYFPTPTVVAYDSNNNINRNVLQPIKNDHGKISPPGIF